MTVKFETSINPNVEWVMSEHLDGYSANWYIYKEVHWDGLMMRLSYTTGYKDEPLPLWITVA